MSFVEAHRSRFAVGLLCQVVDLRASTYYDRRPGGPHSRPSAKAVADAALLERIEAIHERSRATYGSPRVHAQLVLDGHRVGRSRVERLMRQHALQGVCLRRHWRTTIADPDQAKAPDLVKRQFTADAPNRLWVADFSYVRTQQGFLYLAGVLDVFSRRLVGWSMSDRMTTPLVLSALEMGLFRRDVQRGQLTHHADHGSQYTSLAFSQRLADAGIAASMGSVGDAYDNSMIESFWGTIKSELLYRHVWASRHDAEMAIFEWIESWYNRERLHSALGYLSPEQFEQQHHEQHEDQALATATAN